MMIDYDKLRESHNIIDKIDKKKYVVALMSSTDNEHNLIINNCSTWYENIDDVIAKLRELVAPETKYKLGDTVWFPLVEAESSYPVLKSSEIYGVNSKSYDLLYHQVPQDLCFATKSALIEAQIKMWSDMREPEDEPETWEEKHVKSVLESRRDECQHESDGHGYTGYTQGPGYKCIKCGEFYR